MAIQEEGSVFLDPRSEMNWSVSCCSVWTGHTHRASAVWVQSSKVVQWMEGLPTGEFNPKKNNQSPFGL